MNLFSGGFSNAKDFNMCGTFDQESFGPQIHNLGLPGFSMSQTVRPLNTSYHNKGIINGGFRSAVNGGLTVN